MLRLEWFTAGARQERRALDEISKGISKGKSVAVTAAVSAVTDEIKVLYLAGAGRSGSTLLGRLFGEPAQAVHVGELVYLWRRGLLENHLCGCGVPFLECPFWSEVFARGFGGFGGVDPQDILETKRQLERTRNLPRQFFPWKMPVQRRRLEEYRQVLTTLYRAIAETSGARVIVDGSKSEAYGYLLETVPGLDLRALHLVRDSRAVAYSLQRRKPDPARPGHSGTLPTTTPARAALLWNASNLLLTLKTPGRRHAFLRYEDFVADPPAAVTRLWALMEEPLPALDFLGKRTLRLRTNHTVAGNPDRFRADVTIWPDIEWREKLPARDKLLVTALTLPLLRRYGYLPLTAMGESRVLIHPARVL